MMDMRVKRMQKVRWRQMIYCGDPRGEGPEGRDPLVVFLLILISKQLRLSIKGQAVNV